MNLKGRAIVVDAHRLTLNLYTINPCRGKIDRLDVLLSYVSKVIHGIQI